MNIKESPQTDVLEETDLVIEDIKLYSLVVFNDDVNTFDHVIDTLIDVCDHTPEQAEQCSIIIHFKGKCAVNSGEYNELLAQRNEICYRGISAEVVLK